MEKNQQDVAYFAAIPWCAEHLNRKNTTIWLPPYRAQPPQAQHDTFISVTLNTPSTIPNMVCFYHDPPSSTSPQASSPSPTPAPGTETAAAPPPPAPPLITEFKTLLSLSDLISGYPATAHGGAIATILDEVLGLHGRLNHQRGLVRTTSMTGYLNTRFYRALPVPGVVLVISTIEKIEGRKCFMGARLEGEDGLLFASAEAVFVALKERL